MAVLIPPSARVETSAASPAPISGGKLRVYTVNTTSLASTYSDENLTTPLTNPVVANSNGLLPSIFIDEGAYDLAYLDASSVALSGQSYNDWPSVELGSANSIERTLSGSRINISGGDVGSGNTGVMIRAGDPAPDVTGGRLGFWGWLSTVLDEFRVNATSFYLTGAATIAGALNVVGLITENSKKLSGVVYTEGSFSAVSTTNITLPNSPTNVRRWVIELIDLAFSTTSPASFTVRLSYDGSTYKSGASDYSWTIFLEGTASMAPSTDAADSLIPLMGSTNVSAATCVAQLEVTTVVSGSGVTRVSSLFDYNDTTGEERCRTVAVGLGGYGRAQAVQLAVGSGTMTGRYRVVPQRGFGE